MKGKPFRDRDNQALHDKRMNESVRVAISRKNIECAYRLQAAERKIDVKVRNMGY